MFEQLERARFRLGLFGDMMQRIYADGKHDLGKTLPKEWMSQTDIDNEKKGKGTSIERTRRLYVTCSRAMQSLSIIAYTADADVPHGAEQKPL